MVSDAVCVWGVSVCVRACPCRAALLVVIFPTPRQPRCPQWTPLCDQGGLCAKAGLTGNDSLNPRLPTPFSTLQGLHISKSMLTHVSKVAEIRYRLFRTMLAKRS